MAVVAFKAGLFILNGRTISIPFLGEVNDAEAIAFAKSHGMTFVAWRD